MLKRTLASIASLVTLLVPVGLSAHAQTAVTVTTDASASLEVHGNSTSSAAQSAEHGNATSTTAQEEHGDATSSANANGQFTAEAHQSLVASFVQSLLSIANREGGIGAQVRTIAQTQQDSASSTAAAMIKIDSRGAFATFLIGSDYKNLGVLRSEMAKTENNLAKLKLLLASTTDASARAELEAQIKVLETDQVSIKSFITAHESSFSLFGWFVRAFAQ